MRSARQLIENDDPKGEILPFADRFTRLGFVYRSSGLWLRRIDPGWNLYLMSRGPRYWDLQLDWLPEDEGTRSAVTYSHLSFRNLVMALDAARRIIKQSEGQQPIQVGE